MRHKSLSISLLIAILLLAFLMPAWGQEQQAQGARQIGGRPDLQRYEIPFTGAWQPNDDPLLLDENAFSDIENMRYTDKGIKGVAGTSKINTVPFYADYNYTDFTETDVGGNRASVAAHTITITSLDTDEDVYVYKDEEAAHFDGDFEHQFDFECTASTNGVCGLWALTNDVDGLYGLADGDKDHLALYHVNGGLTLRETNGAVDTTDSTDASSNASFDDEDCSDISDWEDIDNGTGVSTQETFDSKSCFKFDSGSFTGISRRQKDMGTFEDRVTVEINLYASNIGTFAEADYFILNVGGESTELFVLFASDGLFISDGTTFNEVGTNLVTVGSWQHWSFDINFSTLGSETVDVYIDEVLQASNVDCSKSRTVASGVVKVGQYGSSTYNRVSYLDYIVVGDGGSFIRENTNYYITTKRVEASNALYAYIYSDEARETSVDTLLVTLTELQDFQYIFGQISYDSASGGNAWSGTISNLTGDIYDSILAGYHFKKDQPAQSYVLVQAENNAGASNVYYNTTAIPDQGNFEETALYTDPTTVTQGRFSSAPQGNVIYCNGEESMIWGGTEHRCAAFILSTAAIANSITNPRDFTEQIQNTLDTSDEVASIGTPYLYGVIGSTRPLQGVKFYVKTPNDTASNIQFDEWTGTAWSALTEQDNTKPGTISLAQTGTITWDSTETTAKRKHLEGRVLYWYRWVLSAGTATISYVTVDAPFQTIKNIWSGENSLVAACKKYASSLYTDYTLEVNDPITSTIAVFDALVAGTDYILLGFVEPQQGFEITFVPGKENSTAATVLTASYWDGDSFASVSGQSDGTSSGGISFAINGVISFTPPTRGTEFVRTVDGGSSLYYYKLVFNQALDAEVEVYYITGIPAPQKVPAYQFALNFQNRVLLCNRSDTPEAVLVSADNAPDVYNGSDSTTLYFGDSTALTAGIGLFNRFGSSIYNFAILCKTAETWILNGTDPDSFSKYQISDVLGCCAPNTMDACEIGYKGKETSSRNVAMWLSYSGPVAFDGGAPVPIKGIEVYFDPNDSRCVNYDAIDASIGFFDSLFKEYNLLIPSGSGQTTNNVWVVYDLLRDKWFKKVPPSYPQCAFRTEDTDGAQYGYLGFFDGYVRRNENGTTYDGTAITQSVTLRDILSSKSMWDVTTIDYLKLICKAKNAGDNESITVKHRSDGNDTWTTLTDVPMYSTGYRYNSHIQRPNKMGLSHQFKFECTTDDKTDGFEPIALGILYHTERVDTKIGSRH